MQVQDKNYQLQQIRLNICMLKLKQTLFMQTVYVYVCVCVCVCVCVYIYIYINYHLKNTFVLNAVAAV